jgi:hypothetical protein
VGASLAGKAWWRSSSGGSLAFRAGGGGPCWARFRPRGHQPRLYAGPPVGVLGQRRRAAQAGSAGRRGRRCAYLGVRHAGGQEVRCVLPPDAMRALHRQRALDVEVGRVGRGLRPRVADVALGGKGRGRPTRAGLARVQRRRTRQAAGRAPSGRPGGAAPCRRRGDGQRWQRCPLPLPRPLARTRTHLHVQALGGGHGVRRPDVEGGAGHLRQAPQTALQRHALHRGASRHSAGAPPSHAERRASAGKPRRWPIGAPRRVRWLPRRRGPGGQVRSAPAGAGAGAGGRRLP